MATFTKLADVQVGQLFRFKGRSEVYKKLDDEIGSKLFTECFAMYEEKKCVFKNWTVKGKYNTHYDRTVEVVSHY